MKPRKMDVFDLEKLLESAKVAEKITEGMVDESVYSVLTKDGSAFESLDSNEVKAILESGSEIKTEMPAPADVEELDAEVKKAFGLLEAMDPSEIDKQPDFTHLKGKTVLLKNKEGREVKARVVDANKDMVMLQGTAGGAATKLPTSKFYNIFVKELMENAAPVVESPTPAPEAKKEEPVMENTESKNTPVEKPAVVESGEKKEDAKLGDGIPGTDAALGKEESPVKDDKKVVENPTGKLTVDHVVEFKHAEPVEQKDFVSAAMSAHKDAQPKNIKKLPENVIETKLLEHSEKFTTFVESLKTPETKDLLECILEGYGVCLEAQKKLISKQAGKVHKGKMHKLLNVPEGEKVTDHFKSGKALANALLKACGGDRKEATGMLAFAANLDKSDNVLDAALHHMKETSDKEDK